MNEMLKGYFDNKVIYKHLFMSLKNLVQVTGISSFTQDDLMAEDIFILDYCSAIYVWVGEQLDSKSKLLALNIGQKFLEYDFLMENLFPETPIFVIIEGNEPHFFTRFFRTLGFYETYSKLNTVLS